MSPPRFRLNGCDRALSGSPDRSLLDILREDHGLMAAKPGCRIGRCGACTVLMEGRPVTACLVMGYRLEGAEILTADCAEAGPEVAVVRAALIDENAFQCGYCASGFVLALASLLGRAPEADEAEIRAALSGNLCRCTGYASILRAALTAQDRLRAARGSAGAARPHATRPG
ncbi:(2Fe-2S)-binding protein [Methylorubrum zatmanii]|uniref:(2Fe-2S)-binding protein n=1 Tax=Methylorubrum zatmanii TaxID=29429 RepID=A0ABW1WVU2_9HYPH|nr:(2Fe-2S)-binding protein [Methylorubrum zatmanii]MBD8905232.1 (2Fe-2S)-binding protein [Methylorubrum zatmanii]